MSTGAVGRLFWKEYRAQRAFWLVVVGVAFGLQVLILLLSDGRVVMPLYGLGMVLTACYAAGCGAVLFAAESEEETRQLVRWLPVSPLKLLAGKGGFALLSTLVMWVLLVGAAALLTGELPARQDYGMLGLINLTVLELLVWAICLSLMTSSVLRAVCLAAVGMLASQLVASFASEPFNVVVRGVVVVVLVGVNAWLARRWITSQVALPGLAWPEVLRRRRAAPAMAASETAAPWRRFAGRLIWQELRHARTLPVVLLAAGVPLCFAQHLVGGRAFRAFPFFILFTLFTPLLLGLWSFRNEQTRQRFRFLAHQGIPGEAVWLSKQAVWLTAAVVLTLVFTGATFFGLALAGQSGAQPEPSLPGSLPMQAEPAGPGELTSRVYGFALPPVAIPLFVLGSYAIGQFVSLLIARTVVAGFIGAILTGGLIAWEALLIWLRVPLVWCVAPIPILLLLATLLRVSDWLIERNTWRGWARVLACPAAAVVLVFAAFVLYRIYEIPAPAFRPAVVSAAESAPPLTPGEAESIRTYEQALVLMNEEVPRPENEPNLMAVGTDPSGVFPLLEERPVEAPKPGDEHKTWQDGWRYATDYQREWLDRHGSALELLMSASEIDEGAWTDPRRLRFGDWNAEAVQRVYWLANLALLSARKLESEQEFDAALERYTAVLRMARHMARRGRLAPERSVAAVLLAQVYQAIPLWAAHSEQTPERIRRAIELLQEEGRRFPELSGSLAVDYIHLRRAIVERSEALWIADSGGSRSHVLTPVLVASRFFSERERALRIVDALAVRAIQLAEQIDTTMQARGVELSSFVSNELAVADSESETVQWLETTPLLMNPEVRPQWEWALISSIDTTAQRRAAELQLALLAYRLEHGRMPESLDELAPGYFELLPLDPWSGREFGYQPDGYLSPLKTTLGAAVAAGQPLLWSAGMADSRVVETVSSSGAREHRVITSNGSTFSTLLAFPIPAAERKTVAD